MAQRVERIDTHAAVVFLVGDRALKLKRAVRFDYLDFSRLDQRRFFCEAEVRLNRRTAPTLYRGVLPVCRRTTGELSLGQGESVVEWLVDMNRFDQQLLFDRLATANRLDLDLMARLATTIAAFHASAAPRVDHGGADGLEWVIDGNAAGFADFGSAWLDSRTCARVTAAARSELRRRRELLDGRRQAGWVRQCHGDLHLGNIVIIDGQPTLFDGVEFNDELSCIDVAYDVAFLLMDLWRQQLFSHANRVLNRYLAATWDLEALALLPLFLSCRAAVRAKTSATAASVQQDRQRRDDLQALATQYLALAEGFLRPAPPCLIAIGGLSGSGKSTAAEALAGALGAAPGAIVLRSDEIRKRLFRVSFQDRLPLAAYLPESSTRVDQTLRESAATTVHSGQATIVDAVWTQPDERRAIEQVAHDAAVPFIGFWLDAPEPTLIRRVERRRNDPSDADADVIHRQHQQETGVISWQRVDASLSPDAVVESIRAVLRHALPGVLDGQLAASLTGQTTP